MEDFFKKTGAISIITSLIFAAVGAILLYDSQQFLTVICYILGTLFIIVGIVKMLAYFSAKGKYDIFNADLAFGLIAIIAGVVAIFASETILNIISIVIGIWIIYSGLIRLGLGIKLRRVKHELWIPVAVIAAIMIACGLYTIMYTNASAIYTSIGIVMIIYSVMDIIEGIIYMKTVNQLYK